MILENELLLDDYMRAYPHLSTAINRFATIVKASRWTLPQHIKNSFGRHADYLAPFWIIDVGGKAVARVIIRVDFSGNAVKIERIWMDHHEYMRWSKKLRKKK